MSPIEIFKVTVDHFRGYREEKTFDFEDGSEVIILAGPNGYGKTSVFDAIEWGFTGRLSRFEEPNEEKNNSCFINFQPFEREGKVYIEFGNKDFRYCLQRESTYLLTDSTDYSYKKSIVCITGSEIRTLYNEKAIEFLNNLFIKEEWRNKIDFTDIFSQYHALTQDKIKRFIQGLKGPDRYKQVSMMVGTQGFYSYKNFFEKNEKSQKDNLKELIDRKNTLEIKINNIKEIVHNEVKINIGDCKTIESWIDYLINKYDKITVQFNIKSYNINKDLNLLDIVSDIKKHAIQTQEKLKSIKNKSVSFKEKLIDVEYNLKIYYKNKSELKVNEIIFPLVEKGYKLLKLQKQLPVYREYSEFSTKNQISILKTSNELKETEMFLYKLTTLYNQIDFILKEINMEKRIEDSIEKLLKNEINLLQNNIPRFDDVNEIIVDSKAISFIKYKQYIEIDMQGRTTLNDLLKVSIDFYKKNINDILINSLNVEENILRIDKKIKTIDDYIKKLSKLEKELKNILNESLAYIKNNNIDTVPQVKCPVCSSDFNRDRLIENIEKKLTNDNNELSSKIRDKNELEIKLKDYQNKLTKSKELYKHFNKDFTEKLGSIKNAIILLGQKIRKQEQKYNDELKSLNEESIKAQEKQTNILDLINSMSLSNDVNKLEEELTLEIDGVNNSLQQIGFSLISLQTDEIQNNIENTKRRIAIFEKNLVELKININNIEDDIIYKTKEVNNKLNSLDNFENDLKYISQSFNEVYQELSNSKKMKELKALEEQFNEMSKQEQHNIKVINILGQLVEASTEAIQEISQQIIVQHQEFINTIYKRINPHPLFTEVEFNFDKNSKGSDILNINCINKNLNNKVNPAFTFSSAQVNVVAVSIFLGMALRQQCSNLKTIMLDDPIQNMDDLNVISFIDILRNFLYINNKETNNKQIIISTHDQNFHRLMIKKFRFVRNKSFEFVGYNNKGPELMAK
jgi:DNA repair exonuclease SbcCD ATPase subunit